MVQFTVGEAGQKSDPVRQLSVIVCTHNPRPEVYPRVLEALHSQSAPLETWELIVVDNRSLEPVATRFDHGWHPGAKILCEHRLGLTPARLRGISEAVGELLVFVDDDNILSPDYLENALEISRSKRLLGAWSGRCTGEFLTPPPEWTRRYWGNLCIRDVEKPVWSNLPRLAATMPAGAGLCVRREVAQAYVEAHRTGARDFQFDRAGASLLSGGDNDLAAFACSMGLGVGLFPELRLIHVIPPDRLAARYLARLAEGISFSSALLDAAWGEPATERSRLGRAIDMLRVMRARGPDREILRAYYRGRDAAARLLAKSKKVQAR